METFDLDYTVNDILMQNGETFNEYLCSAIRVPNHSEGCTWNNGVPFSRESESLPYNSDTAQAVDVAQSCTPALQSNDEEDFFVLMKLRNKVKQTKINQMEVFKKNEKQLQKIAEEMYANSDIMMRKRKAGVLLDVANKSETNYNVLKRLKLNHDAITISALIIYANTLNQRHLIGYQNETTQAPSFEIFKYGYDYKFLGSVNQCEKCKHPVDCYLDRTQECKHMEALPAKSLCMCEGVKMCNMCSKCYYDYCYDELVDGIENFDDNNIAYDCRVPCSTCRGSVCVYCIKSIDPAQQSFQVMQEDVPVEIPQNSIVEMDGIALNPLDNMSMMAALMMKCCEVLQNTQIGSQNNAKKNVQLMGKKIQGKGSRKCHLCNEKGHYKKTCAKRELENLTAVDTTAFVHYQVKA